MYFVQMHKQRALTPAAMPNIAVIAKRPKPNRLGESGVHLGMRSLSFTVPCAFHCVSQSASTSATSRADWKRSSGFLACSLAMMSHSHCGVSGMISRIGRGVSSAHALQHGQRAAGPERRPAGGHLVEHAAEAEQVGPLVERLALGLLRGHVHRRAGDDAALRNAGVVGGPGQAEVGDLDPLRGPPSSSMLPGLMSRWIRSHGVGGGQPLGDLPADPQAPRARRAGRSGRAAAGASRRG